MLMGIAKRPKLHGYKQVIGNETTIRYRKMHAKVKFNGTLVLAHTHTPHTHKYEQIYENEEKRGKTLVNSL